MKISELCGYRITGSWRKACLRIPTVDEVGERLDRAELEVTNDIGVAIDVDIHLPIGVRTDFCLAPVIGAESKQDGHSILLPRLALKNQRKDNTPNRSAKSSS